MRFGTDVGGVGILVDFLFFRYLMCIILSIILEESVAGGVVDPGVLVGAAHARVQVEGLAGELVSGQLAAVGGEAGALGRGLALLLPQPEELLVGGKGFIGGLTVWLWPANSSRP